MADRLRAGVIGRGFMGRVHAHAIRVAGGNLVALTASSPESAEEGARELGAERPAATVEDLLSSPDIDVVHICTPNSAHAPIARAALAAGKHVVCEKPLATSVADARALTEQAAAAGLVAAVPFVYRSYAAVREARARVARGAAGRVHSVHGHYLQDWLADPADSNWRVEEDFGGASRAFADIGVHWCDLVEFVSGHRIQRLVATTSTVWADRGSPGDQQPVQTEDAAAVLFTTDQGAHGTLTISQVSLGRKNQLAFSVDGTEASYRFDQERPDVLVVGGLSAVTLAPREPGFGGSARYSSLPAGHPQGYQDAFNSFVADVYDTIDGRTVDGLPTFADGLRAARITAAVLESAAHGHWVEVPR